MPFKTSHPSTTLADALALRETGVVGPYEIVRLIGSGGMGLVYEAHHQALGKRVALKQLRVRNRDRQSARTRFERAARAAAQLRHPHIVNVFDLGVMDEQPFLVMDLVEGPTLAERLREHGPLTLREIVATFLPIASAVATAHKAGLVHRDLKPANVILSSGPGAAHWPVVVDFGISKLIDDDDPLTEPEAIVGTLPYLAPELARDPRSVCPASDQYALGVMLYECATGRRPFAGAGAYDLLHAIVTASPVPPSELSPELPRDFDAVVAQAMSREPAARFGSVTALGSALLSFATRREWTQWGAEFAATSIAEPDTQGTAEDVYVIARPSPLALARKGAIVPGLVAGLTLGLVGGVAVGHWEVQRAPPAVVTAPTVARADLPVRADIEAPSFRAAPASERSPSIEPALRDLALPTERAPEARASHAARPQSSSGSRLVSRNPARNGDPSGTPSATASEGPAASDGYGTRHAPILE